jgi:drug/metabolite transporter (DMT)-like permease
MTKPNIEYLAIPAVAVSGLVWGIFWIPLRALNANGVTGVWALVLFYLLPTVLLLPVIFLRRRHLIQGGFSLHIAGIFAGTGLVLYAGSLVFTDIVRALLFFYLTPLWSTLLARIFIGEPITGIRWGTIGLALIGLLLILNVDIGLGGPLRPGDWMGLASGFVWAIAAVWMKSDTGGNGVDFTLSYFVWGSVAAFALTALPLEGTGQPPDWETIRTVLPWIVPVVLFLVIPPTFAVMWGATILSPGLLAILFMTEISAGTITAAIWANEPFGLREAAGIALITGAGVLEPIITLYRGKSA